MGQRTCQRVKMVLPIRISGEDANGKAFSHLAHTLDFSRMGARLGGVKVELRVDDDITVEYKRNRGRFKVRWLDSTRYQAGVESVDPEKFKFMDLPEEKYLDAYEGKGPREWTPEPEPPARPPAAAAVAGSKPAAAVSAATAPAPTPVPVLDVTPSPAVHGEPAVAVEAAPVSVDSKAAIPAPGAPAKPGLTYVQPVSVPGKLADLKRKLRESKSDTDTALQFVTTTVCELLPAKGAAVALVAGEDWLCRASAGVAPRVGVRFQAPEGLTGTAASTRQVVICRDTEADPRVNVSIWRSVRLRSAASVPVMSRSNTVGVLEVFADAPDAFGEEHGRLLGEISELVAELVTDSTVITR